jgi:hypothetical protein
MPQHACYYPSEQHERRVDLLDDLAISAGFWCRSVGSLPNGVRPDVFRYHPRTYALFIGDAKETEAPTNLATQSRLFTYLRLIANPAVFRHGSIFAVCFGRVVDRPKWKHVVQHLANCAGLGPISVRWHELDSDDYVVSLLV